MTLDANKTWYLANKFVVDIDGISDSFSFSKATGLEVEMQETEYREGSCITPLKIPTRPQYSDLTLERASCDENCDLYEWFTEVVDTAANTSNLPGYKRTMTITQLGPAGEDLRSWDIYGAYPKAYSPGDFDATSDDLLMEKLVIGYDYFEKTDFA